MKNKHTLGRPSGPDVPRCSNRSLFVASVVSHPGEWRSAPANFGSVSSTSAFTQGRLYKIVGRADRHPQAWAQPGTFVTSISLSARQKSVLSTVIELYETTGEPANGNVIAETEGRAPGTIRNQMQPLRDLNLVEGVPGPRGGYRPTSTAYELLGYEELDQPAVVPVTRNGVSIDDVIVEAIDLVHIDHPQLCRAELLIRGPVRSYHCGDEIQVGPTPKTNFVLKGRIEGTDESNRLVVVDITEITAT